MPDAAEHNRENQPASETRPAPRTPRCTRSELELPDGRQQKGRGEDERRDKPRCELPSVEANFPDTPGHGPDQHRAIEPHPPRIPEPDENAAGSDSKAGQQIIERSAGGYQNGAADSEHKTNDNQQ